MYYKFRKQLKCVAEVSVAIEYIQIYLQYVQTCLLMRMLKHGRYRKCTVQLKSKFSCCLAIKFKRMNCVGNVTYVAEIENLTERDHLEDVDINGRII